MAFIDKKNDDFGTDSELDPVDEILRQINEKKINMLDADAGQVSDEGAQTIPSTDETGEKEDITEEPGKDTDEVTDEVTGGEAEEDTEDVPEDENDRCIRCGKRRRDTSISQDYEYCSKCRLAMLKAPLKWQGFVAAIALIFVAGIAFAISACTAVVALPVTKADEYASQKRMSDALTSYTDAQTQADTLNTQFNMTNLFTPGTKTFVKQMEATATASSPLSVGQTLSTAINNEKAYKSIWLKSLKPYSDMYTKFKNTQAAVEPLVADYQSAKAADVPYDELVAKMEALKTGPDADKYFDYFIEYYKCYVAVLADKGAETELMHMLEVKRLAPQASWLYNYYLVDCYKRLERYDEMIAVCDEVIAANANSVEAYSLKARAYCSTGSFDKAFAVCDDMDKTNDTSAAAFALKAEIYRRSGDIETSVSLCDQGITGTEGSTELYRQQAISLLLKDDKAGAYEAATNAYNSAYYNQDTTLELMNTVALCASLAGETEKYNETVSALTSNGYSLSESVTQIIDGTKTVQDIFISGKGDVL